MFLSQGRGINYCTQTDHSPHHHYSMSSIDEFSSRRCARNPVLFLGNELPVGSKAKALVWCWGWDLGVWKGLLWCRVAAFDGWFPDTSGLFWWSSWQHCFFAWLSLGRKKESVFWSVTRKRMCYRERLEMTLRDKMTRTRDRRWVGVFTLSPGPWVIICWEVGVLQEPYPQGAMEKTYFSLSWEGWRKELHSPELPWMYLT